MYNGQTPSRSNDLFWKGNVNWLSSGELNKSIVTSTVEKISDSGKIASHLKLIKSGTLVIAITGLEAAGTRGNCAILGIDTTLNQSCMALIPNSKLDTHFLFQWYLKYGDEYGIRYTQGTKQQSYNAEILKKLPIAIPSIEEQKHIERILSKIDSVITLYQRQLETNTFIRKSIMQFVFPLFSMNTPRLRFNVYKNPWEKTNVSDLYKKETRKNDGSYGKEQIISVANMYYKKDALISNQSYLKTYNILKKGNIAFEGNKSNSFRYGRMVENTIGDGIVSHVFDVFEPIKDYDLNFWKYYINYEPLMGRLLAKSTTKATMMTNLVAKDFLRQKLFVPSINEQKMIGHILELLDHKIELTTNKINKLKKIKKFLLDKLFV